MKKLIILFVAFLMLVFCNATASQAVTLSFDQISQDVLVGDQANVDLVISGLGVGGAPSLSVFDLDIGYDPTILSFTDYALGSYLGDISLFEASDLSWGEYSSGVINISELSFLLDWELDALQPSSFTLATLTFDTLKIGTSSLDISTVWALGDGTDLSGNVIPLSADLESGSINVVPEPATMLLLGSGLAGLGFLRKKKNQVG